MEAWGRQAGRGLSCEFARPADAEEFAVMNAKLGWRLVGIFYDPWYGYRVVMGGQAMAAQPNEFKVWNDAGGGIHHSPYPLVPSIQADITAAQATDLAVWLFLRQNASLSGFVQAIQDTAAANGITLQP